MMNGLADFLQGKSKTQLRNESFMEEAVLDRIEELKQVWCTDALDILVEYFYMPLTPEEEKTENTAGGQEYLTMDEVYQNAEPEEKEPRINEYAAQEDYDSLFLLRTADYQRMTIADFDRMLLDWANENFDAYERIREDCYRKERQVVLSEEELFFYRYNDDAFRGRKLPDGSAFENGKAGRRPWLYFLPFTENDSGRPCMVRF